MSPAQPTIGVVGSTGAVGTTLAAALARSGSGRLRLGGRRPDALRALADQLPGVAEPFAFDLDDGTALRRFCTGCTVVVNCAAPSYVVLDRVAQAALAAGADYVDPGGDLPVMELLRPLGLAAAGRRAVLTAGMMPGLSSLIPRRMADDLDRATGLTAYVGTLDHLTLGSAADYLLSLGGDHGVPNAGWIAGRRAPNALEPILDVELPFFAGRVTAYPYLSAETERLAGDLGLQDVSWYNVFDGGAHMLAALGRLQGAMSGHSELEAAARELAAAAELDLFGRDPYQLMVFELRGELGGSGVTRSFVLRANSTYSITAAVAAMTTDAVLRGEVAPGAHFADAVLDPAIADNLCDEPSVSYFELLDQPLADVLAADVLMEEGAV